MAHSFNHKNVPAADRKLARDSRRSRIQAASTKRAPERDGWSFFDSALVITPARNGRFVQPRG